LASQSLLAVLSQKFLSDTYKPYFKRQEAESLFSAIAHNFHYEISELKFADLIDILRNVAARAKTNRDYLAASPAPAEIVPARLELVDALKSLKIIEDWLFYNRHVLDGKIEPGLLIASRYQKDNRPEVVQKVLVIDDDTNYLDCAKEIYDSLGLRTNILLATSTIRQQLEKLIASEEIHEFDLILMDGIMYNKIQTVYGADLIQVLRANDFNGHIVANSSKYEERLKMTAVGADFKVENKNPFELVRSFLLII
jgi:CheY-like chemotaxis protein